MRAWTKKTAISDKTSLPFLKHCTQDTQWHFIGDRTLSGKDMVRQWMAETYKERPKFEVNHLINGQPGTWMSPVREKAPGICALGVDLSTDIETSAMAGD